MFKHFKKIMLASLGLASLQAASSDYIYQFSGGVNYWATGNVHGTLGAYKLSNDDNGVNYHNSGSRLGLWAEANSGVLVFPNLKLRYQDIKYSGTGEINQVINVEIGDIDLSSLLGPVESEIDFSYVEAVASFDLPVEVVEVDMGLKVRLHSINFTISEIGGVKQSENVLAPLPFVYAGVSKHFLDENLSVVAEYSVLPYKGITLETIDAFVRYRIPVQEVFPVDLRVQAGYQAFSFSMDSDSDFNFFPNQDSKFGFESIVLGVSAAF